MKLDTDPKLTAEFAVSEEGQREITAFIESLRSEVGSKEGYYNLVSKAEPSLTPENFQQLFDITEPYRLLMPPGHDAGHLLRDVLGSLAIAHDPAVVNGKFRVEMEAAIVAGSYHDIGNSIIHRYHDTKYANGHGEVAAYLMYTQMQGMFNTNLCKLVAYNIAAHTHYLSPVKTESGYVRQPYFFEIYEEDKHLIGFSPVLTRWSDRAEALSVVIFARHLNAMSDAQEGGKDFSAGGFFEINRESHITMLTPIVRPERPRPPTVLEHMLMFAENLVGGGAYSANDQRFKFGQRMLITRAAQSVNFVNIARRSTAEKPSTYAKAELEGFLNRVSKSPEFPRSWEVLSQVWDNLDSKYQAVWESTTPHLHESYTESLIDMLSYVPQNSIWRATAESVFNRVV